MEALYNRLTDAYKEQRRHHDTAAAVWQQAEAVEASFKRLRKGLEQVREWFSSASPAHLAQGLEEARLGTDELFMHFDRMQQVEQHEPHLSTNPYLHEVLRVGRGVLDGKLSVDVLAEVLVRVKSLLKQAAQQVHDTPLQGDGAEAQREAQRLMERVYAGLKTAEQYLTDKQSMHLRQGLEAARVAMEELYALKTRTENAAPTGEARACWRCSQDVPPGENTCPACGFRFPVAVQAVADGPSEAAQPWLRTPSAHTPSEMTERLCVAIEDVRDGGPLTNLMSVTAEARRRLIQGRATVESAPPALGADAVLCEEAGTTVLQAFELMEAGLTLIESYAQVPEGGRLSAGLEQYLLGSDQLMELQEREEANNG